MTEKIRIVLTAANMGPNATEADYDTWAAYVTSHVDEACGVDVATVDQQHYGHGGEDEISGGSEEQRNTVRRWLSVDGWEAWCAHAAEDANDASVQIGTPEGFAR